jgi:hypothetical protein
VQTFLPYASFEASAAALDDLRLGKQRVETLQILRALTFPSYKGWRHHPATAMWRGFSEALVRYGLAVCEEWERRGRADAVAGQLRAFSAGAPRSQEALRDAGRLPPWVGSATFHHSHRSVLVAKLPEHYGERFPDTDGSSSYVWPRPVLPAWPMRGPQPLTTEEADALLRSKKVDTTLWRSVLTARAPVVVVATGPRELRHPPLTAVRPPLVDRAPGRIAESIARPPTPDDLAAVQREASAAPWLFAFHARDYGQRQKELPQLADATVVGYEL